MLPSIPNVVIAPVLPPEPSKPRTTVTPVAPAVNTQPGGAPDSGEQGIADTVGDLERRQRRRRSRSPQASDRTVVADEDPLIEGLPRQGVWVDIEV
ncbi:hypothetical protein [Pseudomonas matsuisoli]|uniref:Aspartate-semialdehyde dehydrogenase n=1 Tax=Pseudomonas matsuisoli TaxID=1515666 RepID=A0A917UWE6_9PSED|nr:hypothetical protein [Pseudomonas matsuisoli]GGJ90227.1 hypothetical protein GCM10009304_14810 [Pseudomonas matsuisoli]